MLESQCQRELLRVFIPTRQAEDGQSPCQDMESLQNMYIEELELSHFRGATSLPLELDSRLNVFFGMNGAGKSSVLDAAAILLSWLVNRTKHSGASGRPIGEQDIQNGSSTGVLSLKLCANLKYYSWNLVKTRRGYSKKERGSDLQQASKLASILQKRVSATDGEVNLPLLAYYPVNRAVLDIPLRIRSKHRFDLFSAYENALTGGADFRTFFEWFREREDLENENRKYVDQFIKPDGFVFPDPQLETVRQALAKFMPEFSNLTVRRNPLRMEVHKHGKPLTVNQLSDGEKCLMAMVGDMARRMAIANPLREDPLNGVGIVLIDELDLHLHPKWQRMLIPRLLEVFPKCQFIVSTHSPHVVTHVHPENLYLLKMSDDGLSAERPSESYGKSVERVLEDLMGLETTRPDSVYELLNELHDYIGQGDLEGAKAKSLALVQKIGDDPDLVKANVLIKRKELIGK